MSVAEVLEIVYTKISGVLTIINNILDDKMIDPANTFYDLPDRISRITGADDVIDGTVTTITSLADNVQLYKFYYCDAIRSISMPLATEIGECAFSDCTNLKEISFPSATFVGMQAFAKSGVETVVMPNVSSTGGSAFMHCASLKTVVLPSLRIVESGLFYDCTSLNTVDLTDVNSISANSFAGCTSLEDLIIRKNGVCSLTSARAFDGSGISMGTGFIYVPQDQVSKYLVATNWTVYRNRIRPIEAYPEITGYVEE